MGENRCGGDRDWEYHDDETDYVTRGEKAPRPGERREGGGRCAGNEDGVVHTGGAEWMSVVEPVVELADACDEARGERESAGSARVGGHRVMDGDDSALLSTPYTRLVIMSLLNLLAATQPAIPLPATAVRVLDAPPAFYSSLIVRAFTPSLHRRSHPPGHHPSRQTSHLSLLPLHRPVRAPPGPCSPITPSRPLTRAS